MAYGFIDGIYQGVSALVRIAGGYRPTGSDPPKWVAVAGYALSGVTRLALLLGAASPPSPPWSPPTGWARACARHPATR